MQPQVVICGTYHKDHAGLMRIFRELQCNGCRILSPLSIDFIDLAAPIVKSATEQDLPIFDLQAFQLRAMRDADFIFLHAPNGHIGLSAAYEIGYAEALKKPVFCFEAPQDEMLNCQVTIVRSVFEILETIRPAQSIRRCTAV
jgi:hypothetical protein